MPKFKRVYISTHDPIVFTVMDETEVNDTFGDEFMDDYGKEIPAELLDAYKKNAAEFDRIQEELKKYWS